MRTRALLRRLRCRRQAGRGSREVVARERLAGAQNAPGVPAGLAQLRHAAVLSAGGGRAGVRRRAPVLSHGVAAEPGSRSGAGSRRGVRRLRLLLQTLLRLALRALGLLLLGGVAVQAERRRLLLLVGALLSASQRRAASMALTSALTSFALARVLLCPRVSRSEKRVLRSAVACGASGSFGPRPCRW